MISFANTKKEGETTVIIQHILAILSKLKRSIVLKENVVYEVRLRYYYFGVSVLISHSSPSEVNGPLRGINGLLSCRCAIFPFDLCHSVPHGLAQPNIGSFVSFDDGPRANGACMGTRVLEADTVVGSGLPGRRVGRH